MIFAYDFWFGIEETKDWPDDLGKFKTPKQSYLTWLNDSARIRGKSASYVRCNLDTDERGGTLLDGIALVMHKPGVLMSHSLSLPGSQVGSDYAPCVDLCYGQPWFGDLPIQISLPSLGTVVAGREITTNRKARTNYFGFVQEANLQEG